MYDFKETTNEKIFNGTNSMFQQVPYSHKAARSALR